MRDTPQSRPRWWPETEPFPPERWRRHRRRFLVRAALAAAIFMALVAFACGFTFWVAAFSLGALEGPGREGMPMARPIFLRSAGPFALLLGVLVVGVVIFATRRLLIPISEILQAAARVEAGDYSVRVQARGPRDVRGLGRAFNAMVSRLDADARQRRQLLADLAHELRTPLTVLQGLLEGQLDGVYPRDDMRLNTALDQTRQMARLIDDLRTLTLTEAGALKLEREGVSLADLIEESIAAFSAQAGAAGVSLTAALADPLPPLDADPVRLREVLANLISNALRYTSAGGAIRIAAEAAPEGVTVSVTDTGRGITSEDLPRIFDRFYKGADSGGTGLGLAIAKALVDAHGGTIAASSGVGKGATISFTLPAAAK